MLDLMEDLLKNPEGHKFCSKCVKYKPFAEFSKDKSKKDGLAHSCKSCYKQYHAANRAEINNRRKEHHSKYKERAKAYYKVWYKSNYETKVRNKFLTKKYGITVSERNLILDLQNGRCKICNTELDNGKRTHIDHCHLTGKVRGILCHTCNTKLGWYEKHRSKVDKYLE